MVASLLHASWLHGLAPWLDGLKARWLGGFTMVGFMASWIALWLDGLSLKRDGFMSYSSLHGLMAWRLHGFIVSWIA